MAFRGPIWRQFEWSVFSYRTSFWTTTIPDALVSLGLIAVYIRNTWHFTSTDVFQGIPRWTSAVSLLKNCRIRGLNWYRPQILLSTEIHTVAIGFEIVVISLTTGVNE